MATDINRVLLELEKYRKETNKEVINPKINVVNLETLKPIVNIVSKARVSYLTELIELANLEFDEEIFVERVKKLKDKRSIFDELVKATNAFETIIERGYVDMEGIEEQ